MPYTPQDPPSQVDLARARLGDLGDPPVLADWLYLANLGAYDENEALARLAESMGLYYAQIGGDELTLGDQKIKAGDKAKYYFALAKSLREEIPDLGTDSSNFGGAVGRLPDPCFDTLDYSPYGPCTTRFAPYGSPCWPGRLP